MTLTIGMMGAGNLGQALISGLQKNTKLHLMASARTLKTCQKLSKKFGIETTTNNQALLDASDIVFLGLKPGVLSSVLTTLRPKKQLFISLAAAMPTERIDAWLESDKTGARVIRCMSGTPARIGESANVLYAGKNALPEDKLIAEEILASLGETAWVNTEKELDTLSSVVSCGPAYIFYWIEHQIEALVKEGIDRQLADRMVRQTVFGAAHMAKLSSLSAVELRQEVVTPNGLTAQAIKVFDEAHFPEAIHQALQAVSARCDAYKKEHQAQPLIQETRDFFFYQKTQGNQIITTEEYPIKTI